jgi:hypothetical protein
MSDSAQRYTAQALCQGGHLEVHGGADAPRHRKSQVGEPETMKVVCPVWEGLPRNLLSERRARRDVSTSSIYSIVGPKNDQVHETLPEGVPEGCRNTV